MRPPARLICAAAAVLVLGGCNSQQQSDAAPESSTTAEKPDTSAASGGHGEHGGHHDGAQHGSPARLQALLLTAEDLPDGYAEGAGHHEQGGGTEPLEVDASCLPIAELIGTDASVHQQEHPQGRVGFSAGHFGSQLSHTIIDLGSADAAADAFAEVEQSVASCARYRQSTAASGANLYDVAPLQTPAAGDASTALRLQAVGRDFTAVSWDVVVAQSGQHLMAVGLRTSVDGSKADLQPAVRAALSKVSGG